MLTEILDCQRWAGGDRLPHLGGDSRFMPLHADWQKAPPTRGGSTLPEILDHHDVVDGLVGLGVKHPPSVRRNVQARTAEDRRLLRDQDRRYLARGETIELDHGRTRREVPVNIDSRIAHSPGACRLHPGELRNRLFRTSVYG